ncbi:endonuclease/exonuclease/phosphatase family protein [Actinomadura sp. ATCC 31491]|uniref:Endonuclease/exonuclease/phosphatase family protein n=1 Tax=Actinomadura luzonensis TaxID=2805427 RepID=A0ABT0G786_9ACTN|nr:endonuclease/exonuclease/phosphatase family protein [Actinomadura luzonensis]MCK2220248.1 endonuclease/exonuclease/phosphatase family protein [Actinomadura luzonensis]
MEEVAGAPAPGAAPRPRRWRRWASRLVVAASVVFAAGTAVRLGGLETGALLVPLVSFTPYFALAAALTLVPAALLRSRAAVAILLAVCACLAWCVAPRAIASAEPAQGRPLRLLTANLNGGRGDAATIVGLVRSHDVDVLSLQELTYSERGRLKAAGLESLLPYQVTRPEVWGPEGSGLYARYPLRERTGLFRPVGHHMPVAEVSLPGGQAVEVVVVHPVAPVPSTVPEWHDGVATLPPAPASGPPRVLAGDFNATLDHAVLRDLLGTGYTDAAAATGEGLVPTWPMRRFPPLVAIDHVLTDGRAGAVAVRIHDVPGSDHRALFADLRVRP